MVENYLVVKTIFCRAVAGVFTSTLLSPKVWGEYSGAFDTGKVRGIILGNISEWSLFWEFMITIFIDQSIASFDASIELITVVRIRIRRSPEA